MNHECWFIVLLNSDKFFSSFFFIYFWCVVVFCFGVCVDTWDDGKDLARVCGNYEKYCLIFDYVTLVVC